MGKFNMAVLADEICEKMIQQIYPPELSEWRYSKLLKLVKVIRIS